MIPCLLRFFVRCQTHHPTTLGSLHFRYVVFSDAGGPECPLPPRHQRWLQVLGCRDRRSLPVIPCSLRHILDAAEGYQRPLPAPGHHCPTFVLASSAACRQGEASAPSMLTALQYLCPVHLKELR
ncbi:hypothetical protein NDU88_004740 [Pleurodeles waltl]|uniref:Uncharacterized protein n=1 Tax=Pleurodeles waltl TaxID=8319 RepID=A0AAV7TSS5_PLEWA|nr:hypothetical protein NDU88_004740 [Pleurodeles waltl]